MTHEIKLSANKYDEPYIVNATFGESKSHTFVFTIYDTNDSAMNFSGCTARFIVEKKSGKIYEGICEVSGTQITHTPTVQAFTSLGRCPVIIDILGPSNNPYEKRVGGLSLQVAPVNYDELVKNSDEFLYLTQLIYRIDNIDQTIIDEFEAWFKTFTQDSTARIDDAVKLLQDVNMSENKAAYLAFLSRAAVPSWINLRMGTSTEIKPKSYIVIKGYEQTEFNTQAATASIAVDGDGIITFTDDCDLVVSVQVGYQREYPPIATDTSGLVAFFLEDISGQSDISHAWEDHSGITESANVGMTARYFRYTKGRKLRLRATNNTNEVMCLARGYASPVNILFQILPDISRFPTSQMPRVVDVIASEQDIQPGDTLPKDSLYLVIEP